MKENQLRYMRRKRDGTIGQHKGHLTELAAIQQQQHQNRFSGFFAVPIQERFTTNTGIVRRQEHFNLMGCLAERRQLHRDSRV